MSLQNSINAGKVIQNPQGKINLDTDTSVFGLLSVIPKFEVKNSFTGVFIYPWSEATKNSARIDGWTDNEANEYELSIFRDTFCTNAKSGIAVYRPNKTDTVNAYISANGNSFLCSNNGNVGIGTATPLEKLHVNGFIRSSTGLKLGVNLNLVQYAAAAPTTGTWNRGDIIHNTAPSPMGFAGWICTTSGTPGTWKTWGAISM